MRVKIFIINEAILIILILFLDYIEFIYVIKI